LQKGENLDRVLTLCERRTLSKNLTLSYNNGVYQSKTKRAAYTMRNAQVEVREASTGEVTIEYKGRALEHSVYREQEQHQAKVVPSNAVRYRCRILGAASTLLRTPCKPENAGENSASCASR
jgi:hypothetical protein